jgi:hypothetical protein
VTFADNAAKYLGKLKADGLVEGWRLTRCKLGLRPGAAFPHLLRQSTEALRAACTRIQKACAALC